MLSLFRFEMKTGIKQLLIWSFAVGGMGLVCIALYQSMEGSIGEMADSFAEMGAFAEAFGMDRLSIATVKGYFSTEIGTIHSLGSAMFAAATATVILSKEEDGHTAEFTFTLPVSRMKIIVVKFLSVIINLVIFTVICAVLYEIGFLYLGTDEIGDEFIKFMLAQLIMNVEIASICFLISAINRKNKLGLGIALAMFLYFFDLIGRVIPKLKDVAVITPLSYANATEIFSGESCFGPAMILGIILSVGAAAAAGVIYNGRDLAG